MGQLVDEVRGAEDQDEQAARQLLARWEREVEQIRAGTLDPGPGGRAGSGRPGAGRVDAVVAVSAPAFWYYRGTRVMRLVLPLATQAITTRGNA